MSLSKMRKDYGLWVDLRSDKVCVSQETLMDKFNKGTGLNFFTNIGQGSMPFDQRYWREISVFDQ